MPQVAAATPSQASDILGVDFGDEIQ